MSPLLAGTSETQARIDRIILGNDDAPDLSRIDDAVVVVAHFAQALGADGWALTTSSDHSVTRSLADDGLAEEFRDALLRVADRIDPGVRYHVTVPVWCELLHPHRPATAMVMAVQWTPGHACIFVNLLFADLDDDKRKSVEGLCLREWPSVSAYFRLWQVARIERRRAAGIEAGLDRVAIGIVLLGEDSHIVFANDTARMLMKYHDGIREHRGQVQATHRADAAALSAAIGYVMAQADSHEAVDQMPLLKLRRENGPPLVTSFAALTNDPASPNDGGALLFFVDPGLDIHQLAEPVCKLFQLSRVETELACLLASGQTLASAAQSLHVKLGTARGYLKQIFVKTGSNRQVDLVRLIFSNLVRTAGHATGR
jgi:DNA-binding CsgD family transcriptional regulator